MNARRILIPVVAGLMISPALMAADLDTNSVASTFSTEYLGTAAVDDVVVGSDLAVELGAEYATDDVITLDFSGSALDGTTLATSVTVPATLTTTGITLGLLSADSDQAIYRVTDITPPTDGTTASTTVGLQVSFADATVGFPDFNAQAVNAAGGVTVSFSAATSTGLALDTSGGDLRNHDYILTVDEYEAKVTTSFDQTVDVNQDRKAFTTAPGDTTDTGETTLTNASVAGGETTFVDQEVVWSGDFSWIIDDDPNTAGIQPIAGVVTLAACATVEVTVSTITGTACATGAATLVLDPGANTDTDGLRVLPATTYTVSVTVNFTGFSGTAGSVTFSNLAGGSWVLNGYQALIPYMPFGTSISQVIYLANRGTQAGDVTVDWIGLNGTSGTLGVIATLEAGTTLSIGPLINSALPAAQRASGRLALTVTANVPSGDVQMNSQYNVSGNRAFTLHEDNRN